MEHWGKQKENKGKGANEWQQRKIKGEQRNSQESNRQTKAEQMKPKGNNGEQRKQRK